MSPDSHRDSLSIWDAPDPGDPSLLPKDSSKELEKLVDSVLVEIVEEPSPTLIDIQPFDQAEELSGRYRLVPSESAEALGVIEPEIDVVKTEPEVKRPTPPVVTLVEPDEKEKVEVFRKKLKIRVVEIRRHRQRRRRIKFLVALMVTGILLALLMLSFSRVAY